MLSTTAARVHTGCQFHLKRGEFLLFAAGDSELGVLMTFKAVAEGVTDSQVEVMADHVGDEMWNLTLCNFPAEHSA
jgi:hypothetical protein